jgi:two-component system sensor histidine kinase UhpB
MKQPSVEGGPFAISADTLAKRDLAPLYADALQAKLGEGGEGVLHRAYEIGRRAMADGLGLLEMATMHHEALARALGRPSSRLDPLAQELRRAGEFFAESLSPYEMAHRGFREAVSALRQLNETMEGEIQRMAHAVHDEAGQLLDAARLVMSGVAHDVAPPLQDRLREVGAILDQAEKELRRLAHELRPTILDDLGLLPALQLLADGVSRRTSVSVSVESSLGIRLPTNVETTVYRIVQEALTNVTRHSRARNVKIELARDTRLNLRCSVRDDGLGFDPATVPAHGQRRGLGLVGIRERLNAVGGTLQIRSARGQGTELIVDIPLES